MLLVPLVTGAAAGNPRGVRLIWILLFAAIALGLFCLRTPVEAKLAISPLRPQNDAERRLILISIYTFASVVGSALAVLILWARPYGLLLIGAVAAIAFLLLAAFGPLFLRGFAWFVESPRPLQVHRLGFSELLYAIVFGIFFITGFHYPMG
jgi:hypothetical protein